jgi:hypothetical protein
VERKATYKRRKEEGNDGWVTMEMEQWVDDMTCCFLKWMLLIYNYCKMTLLVQRFDGPNYPVGLTYRYVHYVDISPTYITLKFHDVYLESYFGPFLNHHNELVQLADIWSILVFVVTLNESITHLCHGEKGKRGYQHFNMIMSIKCDPLNVFFSSLDPSKPGDLKEAYNYTLNSKVGHRRYVHVEA